MHDSRANEAESEPIGIWHRLLLSLPAESAHNLAVSALRVAQAAPFRRVLEHRYQATPPSSSLRQSLLGRSFGNPVGLAAGFDKDALVVPGMAALGFGWLEVGAVTPRPQAGNPRPRLFRHRASASLENAMGFNNSGVEAMCRRLDRRAPVPVWVNLGKNRDTDNERAVDDYLLSAERLDGRCDGFVINVSSPNTPGLRDLQAPERVGELVRAVGAATASPLLVKLSPDLTVDDARRIARECVEAGAAGLVLTNTTTDYELLPGARKVGGLSGAVLRERSRELLRAVGEEFFGRCVLVSVGGIATGDDVYERLRLGASLVQLYTALVYRGPKLVGRLLSRLQARMAEDDLASLDQVIGLDLATSRADPGNKEPAR